MNYNAVGSIAVIIIIRKLEDGERVAREAEFHAAFCLSRFYLQKCIAYYFYDQIQKTYKRVDKSQI